MANLITGKSRTYRVPSGTAVAGSHFASMTDEDQEENQPVSIGSTVDVLLYTVAVDTDGFVTFPGVFTIPASTGNGIYRVAVWGRLAAADDPTTGCVVLTLFTNGNPDPDLEQQLNVPIPFRAGELNLNVDLNLTTGDYVLARVHNETDIDLEIRHSFGSERLWRMTIQFIGPI